jgi:hypothetical protein
MGGLTMIYETCCINSTAELINAMTEKSSEITYKTFRRHAEGLKDLETEFGYGPWLRLKNDFHVRYFKGFYNQKKCVFMVHSAIEYIWTE